MQQTKSSAAALLTEKLLPLQQHQHCLLAHHKSPTGAKYRTRVCCPDQSYSPTVQWLLGRYHWADMVAREIDRFAQMYPKASDKKESVWNLGFGIHRKLMEDKREIALV